MKEFNVSVTGKTAGIFRANTPEEAVEKYLKQLIFNVYEEDNKEFTDFTFSKDEKPALIKGE